LRLGALDHEPQHERHLTEKGAKRTRSRYRNPATLPGLRVELMFPSLRRGLSPVPAGIARKYLRRGNGCQGAESGRKDRGGGGSASGFFHPGSGGGAAPRLLAAFGSQRERYANAEEVQAYSGIAPVTERSGRRRRLRFPIPTRGREPLTGLK
jgi:hypothetical protein